MQHPAHRTSISIHFLSLFLFFFFLQTLLSATTSRKKQQSDLVQSILHQEEEKRRRERENYNITAAPLLTRASNEPSMFSAAGTGEDKDEGA